MTPAILPRRRLLNDEGQLDRLDAEFFDARRIALEQNIHELKGRRLARLCRFAGDVAEPRSGSDPFTYIEIADIDMRDGFVIPDVIPAAEAPSRAKWRVVAGVIGLSTVRPLRSQVFVATPDLYDAVASSGFAMLAPSDDVSPALLFTLLKTNLVVEQLDRRTRTSMYPTLHPPDILDVVVPPIPVAVAHRAEQAIVEALASRSRFLVAQRAMEQVASEFFEPMDPQRLLADIASPAPTTRSRDSVFGGGPRSRLDAEYHAEAFASAAERIRRHADTAKLGEIAREIKTGTSPAASEFAEDDFDAAAAVIKVGLLTGLGLNWSALAFAPRASLGEAPTPVRDGDVLFNVTAHEPLYIAHRVDVVSDVPAGVEQRLSLVADLGRVEVRDPQRTPPHFIAAFLRSPLGREQIRRCTRGVRAHVYPADLAEDVIVPIPSSEVAQSLAEAVGIVEQERKRYHDGVTAAISELDSSFDRQLGSADAPT